MSWGVFPEDLSAKLEKREWSHATNLRKRLLGERPFPIREGLKPPSGAQALQDLSRFQAWIEAWSRWPAQAQLDYEPRSYRQIGNHRVPTALTLANMQELAACLGARCVARREHWEQVMRPFLALDPDLRAPLIRNLAAMEALRTEDAALLAASLPQLRRGMAAGAYLRALAVHGVDTKFVETHAPLLAALLDAMHGDCVTAAGGLGKWLGCRENPKDWLHVRPLCATTLERLSGLPILRLPSEVLLETPLPAARILIVENVQSGLGLPALGDTIAVFGGGANVAWTSAAWLRDRQAAYWGDIDTWGLKFLNDARQRAGALPSIMMDAGTLDRFRDRGVIERDPWVQALAALSGEEGALHQRLLASDDGSAIRLEQERLDADYVRDRLFAWPE